VAYLEACRTIPDLCVDRLNAGTAELAGAFLICDADGTDPIEVPFNEQLNDGRRPGRPNPVPEALACLAEVRKGRRLVAEMRAQIAEMRASAAAMRATAQLAIARTEAAGPGGV